jgi:hypothetical protein
VRRGRRISVGLVAVLALITTACGSSSGRGASGSRPALTDDGSASTPSVQHQTGKTTEVEDEKRSGAGGQGASSSSIRGASRTISTVTSTWRWLRGAAAPANWNHSSSTPPTLPLLAPTRAKGPEGRATHAPAGRAQGGTAVGRGRPPEALAGGSSRQLLYLVFRAMLLAFLAVPALRLILR